MERCDGYQAGVWRYGQVRQLAGSLFFLNSFIYTGKKVYKISK